MQNDNKRLASHILDRNDYSAEGDRQTGAKEIVWEIEGDCGRGVLIAKSTVNEWIEGTTRRPN